MASLLRHASLLCALLHLAACSGGGGGAGSGGDSGAGGPLAPVSGWSVLGGATTSHPDIPVASDTRVNPGRGYYRWDSQEEVPQAAAAPDWYRRYDWKGLELAEDQYDLDDIAADIKTASATGRKLALRIRMMHGYGDGKKYLPDYLVGHANCVAACGFTAPVGALGTFVPDWNDPWLQARGRKLLEQIRAQIVAQGALARIAWIDVGLYGQYGEWAVDGAVYASPPAGISAASDASKQVWARMHFEVFPEVRQLMFALRSNVTTLGWAFSQTITQQAVGLRTDCLAKGDFFDQWTHHPADHAVIRDQWQKAPFIAEFCPFESGNMLINPAFARSQVAAWHMSLVGNGNFALSQPVGQRFAALTPAEQADMLALGREAGYRYALGNTAVSVAADGQLLLQGVLRNLGNAPAYEAWQLSVQLIDSQGQLRASSPLMLDLQQSPGNGSEQNFIHNWNLPALAAGDYTLRLTASRSDRTRPLAWANADRHADGSLTLASLRKSG
ncbi:hypothetical protein Q9Q94_04685 [Uliginosibacterium sp. 31-16]|uniref:hypothetical protein n=1 Tax=Uliginosibacterium sp. 31-16 TaxID=3068315 RepID=UPI0027401075|nr:hypothetical protein [Uliginosibacterium sp. 31-16]MDP5238811.1 hypothetical protein [Uliginosibacterium sp. 31-16]